MSARLEVIVGPMFSGKTERLIAKIKRAEYAGKQILILKPASDTRTSSEIAARSVSDNTSTITTRIAARGIQSEEELVAALAEPFEILAIDEAQFFPLDEPYQDSLGWFGRNIRQLLLDRKSDFLTVHIAGLDKDYLDQPFGVMPGLLSLADSIEKLSAVCMKCGSDEARMSQRIATTNTQVSIGDIDEYQARCRACFEVV
jgi:thymidine kinase